MYLVVKCVRDSGRWVCFPGWEIKLDATHMLQAQQMPKPSSCFLEEHAAGDKEVEERKQTNKQTNKNSHLVLQLLLCLFALIMFQHQEAHGAHSAGLHPSAPSAPSPWDYGREPPPLRFPSFHLTWQQFCSEGIKCLRSICERYPASPWYLRAEFSPPAKQFTSVQSGVQGQTGSWSIQRCLLDPCYPGYGGILPEPCCPITQLLQAATMAASHHCSCFLVTGKLCTELPFDFLIGHRDS